MPVIFFFSVFQYFLLPENGLNRTDFDMMIEEQLSIVAPSWPDPSRLNDAIEAVRFGYSSEYYIIVIHHLYTFNTVRKHQSISKSNHVLSQ